MRLPRLSGSVNELAPSPNRLRARTFVVGLALIAMSAQWLFWGEIVRYTFLTLAAPFCHAVFLLFALTTVNLALRRRRPEWSLNGLELAAIYAMVSVASGIMAADLQTILITQIAYPVYFADSANRWSALFADALPRWLIVTDREAAAGFFRGSSSFFTRAHIAAWAPPIAAWTACMWALIITMASLSILLRKAWAENERLTFPVIALPIQLAYEPARVLSSRTMWLGFALAGGVTLINGLAYLYPAVPSVPIKRQYYQLIASGPLAGSSTVTVSFYFFGIALGFLMPLDLSASLTVFYLLYRAELLGVARMGLPQESRAPYADSQAFGAYMAVLAAAAWRLRGHASYVRAVLRGTDQEARSYRWAVAGLVGGCSMLLAFMVAAGMRTWVAVVFVGLFLAISLMISRIRAEFGFPVHDMHQMGPVPSMVRTCGASTFDHGTLGTFALLHWTSRAYRGHPMPHMVEGLRMAGDSEQERRRMAAAIVIASLAAVPICFAVMLDGFYHLGASTAHVNQWGTGYAKEAFTNNLQTWLRSPVEPLLGDRLATGGGFAAALALASLRVRFPGAPVHPLAYAAANSWGMANLWLPIAVGSACKFAILRIRGLSGYRSAVFFFFGLMLGEFTVGSVWTLIGMAINSPTYEFWP